MNELRCAPSNKLHDVCCCCTYGRQEEPEQTDLHFTATVITSAVIHQSNTSCTKRLHTTNRQCCQLTTPVKGDFTKTCDQSRYPGRVSPCCPSDSQKRYNKCTNHKSRTFPSARPYLNGASDEAWLLLQSINTQNKTLTYKGRTIPHTAYNQSSS